MPTESSTVWDYSLFEVTGNRRTQRTGLVWPGAFSLVGVDGSIEGGLSPINGFRLIHTLAGTGAYDEWDITEFYPITLRVGYGSYAYGMVYRLKNPASGNDRVWLQYRINTSTTWNSIEIGPDTGVPQSSSISPTVWGRLLYLHVQGMRPTLFYIEEPTPSTYVTTLVGNVTTDPPLGPGNPPTLGNAEAGVTGYRTVTASSILGAGKVLLFPTSGYVFDAKPSDILGRAYHAPDEACRVLRSVVNFAYQLVDSRTGRRSPISTIAVCDPDETLLDFWGAYQAAYAALEIVYDSERYDHAHIYRSPAYAYQASIMHLDAIIKLADYDDPDFVPGGGTNDKRAHYFYRYWDASLVLQNTFQDAATFDTYLPSAGEGIVYEGCHLLSLISYINTGSYPDKVEGTRQLGEIRWSSTYDLGVELFPAGNRYVPSNHTSEVLRFINCAGNVVGLGRDRLYFMRKEMTFFKVHEMHTGYGLWGKFAATAVGSYVYFVTPKGLKAVDTNGQLDDVNALNQLIISVWKGDWADISLAYDEELNALFIHNPNKEHTAVLWFDTSKVTEIHDAPWTMISQGSYPENPSDTASPLRSRAMFLGPREWHPTNEVHLGGRIYTYDHREARTISGANVQANGSTRRTLLDIAGDATVVVSSRDLISLSLTPVTRIFTSGYNLGANLEGAYLYVVSATDESLVGQKVRISMRANDGSNNYLSILGDVWPTLAAGDRLAISPVYVRWVGAPLPKQVQDSEGALLHQSGPDSFRLKHVSTIGASFVDVEGATAGGQWARFNGLLFRMNEEDPHSRALTKDRNGTHVPSLIEGETRWEAAFGIPGTSYKFGIASATAAPGIEVYCPDLQFTLVDAVVKGKITGTTTSNLTTS